MRVNLEFNEPAYARATLLKEKLQVETDAELIRHALRILEWFLTQKEKGTKVLIVEDGVTKEIDLVF